MCCPRSHNRNIARDIVPMEVAVAVTAAIAADHKVAAHDPHATETVAALRGLNARMRQRADLLEQLQIGRAPEAQVAGGAVRRIR